MKPQSPQPLTLLQGCCMQQLPLLADESVSCCVTSPPYWMLRDYGIEESDWPEISFAPMAGLPAITIPAMRCQLGLEPDPWAFVGHIVHVFRLVRRVLRGEGTVWMNLGDSYSGASSGSEEGSTLDGTQHNQREIRKVQSRRRDQTPIVRSDLKVQGLPKKNLLGMPWRVAFAMQADGWVLRRDIIWHKPNPMPESARDRPTTSHEFIFLFAKQARYYYDGAAIAEPCSENTHSRVAQNIATQAGSTRANGGTRANRPMKTVLGPQPVAGWQSGPGRHDTLQHAAPGVNPKAAATDPGNHKFGPKQNASFSAAITGATLVRNSRSVWKISTEAYRGDHFATFPREIAARCIKAGSASGGLVLDPFGGTGTVACEAILLGRRAVSIEANPKDIKNTQRRVEELCSLLAHAN